MQGAQIRGVRGTGIKSCRGKWLAGGPSFGGLQTCWLRSRTSKFFYFWLSCVCSASNGTLATCSCSWWGAWSYDPHFGSNLASSSTRFLTPRDINRIFLIWEISKIGAKTAKNVPCFRRGLKILPAWDPSGATSQVHFKWLWAHMHAFVWSLWRTRWYTRVKLHELITYSSVYDC